MKIHRFEAVIKKEPENDGCLAYSAGTFGCFSKNGAIWETERNTREVI